MTKPLLEKVGALFYFFAECRKKRGYAYFDTASFFFSFFLNDPYFFIVEYATIFIPAVSVRKKPT